MSLSLPQRPAKYFITEVLADAWQPADALGYDPTASPGETTTITAAQTQQYGDVEFGAGEYDAGGAFLPVATSIDNVGAVYPSLVVSFSNETSGGESTYDYLTPNGPGQNRTGTLVATARAQDGLDYRSDADAQAVVEALVDEVEAVCQRRAAGGSSEFQSLGSQRGPDTPDDFDDDPTVRLANTQIAYSWLRRP